MFACLSCQVTQAQESMTSKETSKILINANASLGTCFYSKENVFYSFSPSVTFNRGKWGYGFGTCYKNIKCRMDFSSIYYELHSCSYLDIGIFGSYFISPSAWKVQISFTGAVSANLVVNYTNDDYSNGIYNGSYYHSLDEIQEQIGISPVFAFSVSTDLDKSWYIGITPYFSFKLFDDMNVFLSLMRPKYFYGINLSISYRIK